MTLNLSLYQSDNTEWETPAHLFTALHKEFRFTLDAAASAKNAKVSRYYDQKQDALQLRWSGRVWLNPPYGSMIPQFVEKARDEVLQKHCKLVVCLLPVRSDTQWWHRNVMHSTELRLLTRRLSFVGSNNKAPFPACIVIFAGGVYSPVLNVQVV